MLSLLNKILLNKNRDMFVVRLGSTLILTHLGMIGFLGKMLDPLVRGILGFLIEDGTFLIDLSLDSYREGEKLKEFEKAATAAYARASAGVYDEAKKQEIRKEYLEIISKIGAVGDTK